MSSNSDLAFLYLWKRFYFFFQYVFEAHIFRKYDNKYIIVKSTYIKPSNLITEVWKFNTIFFILCSSYWNNLKNIQTQFFLYKLYTFYILTINNDVNYCIIIPSIQKHYSRGLKTFTWTIHFTIDNDIFNIYNLSFIKV